MIAGLLLVAALQAPSPATLDDPQETACYAETQPQKGAERCAHEALTRAESSMALFWRSTLAEYGNNNPRSTKLLKMAQGDWLKYRRAWCDVVAHDNHGSNPSTNAGCQAKLTRERTQAIKELIQGTNE